MFRLHADAGAQPQASALVATTVRPGGARQQFQFVKKAGFWESTSDIPEPHGFGVIMTLPGGEHTVSFEEHQHGYAEHSGNAHDDNMRAAYIHVIADAAVSVLAILGLLLANSFGWLWMDPLAGIVGALVIANWSYGLLCDTGRILVAVSADDSMANKVRGTVEGAGDKLLDRHVWRMGPGHFGAVVSVATSERRGPAFYHRLLQHQQGLSHITVEVHSPLAA